MAKLNEQQLEWRRALRQFKHGIKVRAKLGLLDDICAQVASERNGATWSAPLWDHENWINLLYTSVKNNEYPRPLLIGFAETVEATFMYPERPLTPAHVVRAVDRVLKNSSRQLREKFGAL